MNRFLNTSLNRLKFAWFASVGVSVSFSIALWMSAPAIAQVIAQVKEPTLQQEPAQTSHVYFERGLKKLKERLYQGAIAEFNQAIAIDPTFQQAYSGKGFAYLQLGDLGRSIDSYQQILRFDARSSSAYSGLALVRQRLGDFQQATTDGQKSTSLQLLNTARHIYQGELNMLELSQLAAAQPTGETVWKLIEKGYAKLSARDYHGAVEVFSHAVKVAPPGEGRPYLDRGVAYFWLQEYRSAIRDFSTAIQLNPQSAKSYEYRSRAYQQVGDRKAARSDLQRAIELTHQLGSRDYHQQLVSQLQQLR